MSELVKVRSDQRMSQIVIHNDTVYLAGQTAPDTVASVADQTRQILGKIDGLLAEAGTSKAKLISATIWLTDTATFEEMNAVWDEWVAGTAPPARATVGSALARPYKLVEIAVVAAL